MSEISGDLFAAALLRYGSDAIAISARDSGRFVVVSDSYCALTGYMRDELVGHTSVELGMFADARARARELGPVDGGSGAISNLRLRRRDGAVRSLEFSVQLLAGGELMLTITRDVTERDEAAAMLAASEQRFRAAVESMLDAFFILSPVRDGDEIADFRYEYANPAQCDLVGLGRDQIVGRTVGDIFPAFVGSERFEAYRDALLSGRPCRSEDAAPSDAWVGSDIEGRVLEISIVPVGGNLAVSGRDITDRRAEQTELALRAGLLELAHDAVLVREPTESRIVFWNRGAQVVYGYDATEAGGEISDDLLGTVYPEPLGAVDLALARVGRWAGEVRHTRKDGSVIVVSSRQAVQRGFDGRPAAIIELNSDITERDHAERHVRQLNEALSRHAGELEAANRQLAQRNDGLERLAGGVAHEFNNKLAVVLGYTDVVSRELDAGNPTLAHLAQIRRAADDMAALANDILAFAGQQMLDPRPVAVRRIVDDLERTLGPALGASVEVVVEDGSDGALILADREQLERALMALALNARDAMPDGGQLSVLAGVARERARRDGETVSISMSDTGCGMSEELRKRIFEPFFTTKEIGEGPGLGLAVALGIVKQSDGAITVTSRPGHGSTFVIELPALAREPHRGGSPPDPRSPGRLRVLLVEHEHDVRTIVGLHLTDAGHEVLEADDAEQALTFLCEPSRAIDVLLADLTLVAADGGRIAIAIAEHSSRPRVLYMSAEPEASLRTQHVPAPGGFLAKPFTAEQLAAAIRSAAEATVPEP